MNTTAVKIYSAVYSGVSVFEMNARGIAVMRRRSDSYLNATQILKVAGIEKGKRTKILEREVLIGEHEKVQGGYGKYQGTWIPFEKGKELAERYEVAQYLLPIFEYDPAEYQDGDDDRIPTKDEAMGIRRAYGNKAGHRSYPGPEEQARKRLKAISPIESTGGSTLNDEDSQQEEEAPGEHHRPLLMSLFLSDDPDHVPDLFKEKNLPSDLNFELVIDDQGHTALHWAAALARIKTLRELIKHGADIKRGNFNGETPLMRAVLVTNNYGQQSFPELLNRLSDSIDCVDIQRRSVLHHIAITAGIARRNSACTYYMNVVIQHIQENMSTEEKINFLDLKDNNGDTALDISARLGTRKMGVVLIQAGATRDYTPNGRAKPSDLKRQQIGESDRDMDMHNSQISAVESVFSRSENTQNDTFDTHVSFTPSSKRSREIVTAVQKIVNDLDAEYTGELSLKQQELRETREELKALQAQLDDAQIVVAAYKTQAIKLEEAEERIKTLEAALAGRDRGGLLHFDSYDSNMVEDTNSVLNVLNEERSDSQMLLSETETGKERLAGNGTSAPSNGSSHRSVLRSPRPNRQPASKEQDAMALQEAKIQQLQAKINNYAKSEMELKQELEDLQAKSSDKEMQCKKLIAVCCGIPLDRVDDLLQPLIQAVECEQMANLDIGKVEGFMSAVHADGENGNAIAMEDAVGQ